jgi:hypothetical protein
MFQECCLLAHLLRLVTGTQPRSVQKTVVAGIPVSQFRTLPVVRQRPNLN